MPGGDGTGPESMGSMTGRAMGFCAGYAGPGYAHPASTLALSSARAGTLTGWPCAISPWHNIHPFCN